MLTYEKHHETAGHDDKTNQQVRHSQRQHEVVGHAVQLPACVERDYGAAFLINIILMY